MGHQVIYAEMGLTETGGEEDIVVVAVVVVAAAAVVIIWAIENFPATASFFWGTSPPYTPSLMNCRLCASMIDCIFFLLSAVLRALTVERSNDKAI